jgi:hypothetical protein
MYSDRHQQNKKSKLPTLCKRKEQNVFSNLGGGACHFFNEILPREISPGGGVVYTNGSTSPDRRCIKGILDLLDRCQLDFNFAYKV